MTKPPLPPRLALGKLATLRKMAEDVLGFLHWLHENHGDIVRFELPGRRRLAVFSRELAHEVLVEKTDVLRILHPRTACDVVPSAGLVRMPAGEEHGRLRELIVSAATPERVAFQKHVAAAEANRLVDELPDGTVDLPRTMERLAWNGVTTNLLGRGPELDPAIVRPSLKAVKLTFMLSVLPGFQLLRRLPLPHDLKARRAIRPLDEATREAIGAARASAEARPELICHLVQATEREESGWRFANDREIRDEVYTMLFAALDGPVQILTLAQFYLRDRPEVRERMEAEVDQVVGDRPLQGDDLGRLPFTHAVAMEVLRLHPPAPLLVARRAEEDCTLGGYLVPKGTSVDVVLHVMQRDPESWGDGGAFRPERWFEGPGCPVDRFVPFSFGPKECRGADLATNLIVATLAAVAGRRRLEPVERDLPTEPGLGVGGFRGAIPATVTLR